MRSPVCPVPAKASRFTEDNRTFLAVVSVVMGSAFYLGGRYTRLEQDLKHTAKDLKHEVEVR